ncbi:hypothetical protein BSBH6_00176 [Bacillus subtilis]|nr:hypothetical protein BSBH6_00176 [Bacillus subtilis]RPK26539.1 hypothetical protein BH5_00174 [Bacillus subtilis]
MRCGQRTQLRVKYPASGKVIEKNEGFQSILLNPILRK